MASLTFGGGASSPTTLIPNTSRMKGLHGKDRKGKDKVLKFKNIGTAPMTVVLVSMGRDGNGGFKTLPYQFSVNGTPLEDKGFIVPPGETLQFTANNGALTSVDGKVPEITKESYLIPEFLLPVFSRDYRAAIVSASLVEAEAEDLGDDD